MAPDQSTTGGVLSAIRTYPLKGGRAVALDAVPVTPRGLAGDRHWMVVDAGGRFLSQRGHPRLATVEAAATPAGLRLAAPGRPPVTCAVPDGAARLPAGIWKDTVDAALADGAAGRWLTDLLGVECRLVYQDRPDSRPLAKGPDGAVVSFADGSPVLLCGEGSLADLNGRLPAPVPMDRFRPNLVVAGAPPFAEDGWKRLAVGGVVFLNRGPCPRCRVTTVDQATGAQQEEPLRTLATFRSRDGGVMFGVNLVPEGTGRIRVGDPVRVLA